MKNLTTRILSVLLPTVLLLAGMARAQYAQRTLKAMVPFEFTAGDKIFPAGSYSIVSTAPDRLDVRDSGNHFVASLITHSVEALNDDGRPRLVFSVVGSGYALTQVWMESSRLGYELAQPKPASVVAKRRSPEPAQPTGAGNK